MATTILVVEDDAATRALTAARLKPDYDVRCVENGARALEYILRHHVDLAIVDVMMPLMDGYELVENLRAYNKDLPVLMLTALDSFDAKRRGFDSGIDDYLVKPVNHEELRWRVKALLRRAKISSSRCVRAGRVVLDAAAYTATVDGRVVDLPKKEFDLLFLLLSYPGVIFTKDQLLDRVWGLHGPEDVATLKVHISRLRSRFEDCPDFKIVNMRGLGYKAEVAAEDEGAGRP